MTAFNLGSWNAGQTIFALPYIFLGYAQYTSLGSAISLSSAPAIGVALPAGATQALISVETAGVRYREGGVAPSSSVGMPMFPGGSPLLCQSDLTQIQFIQIAAGAVLNVSYYK